VSSRAVQEADLLLAVGNSLDGTSTGRWTMRLPPQLIQVDLVAEQIGASYGDRTFGVVGDARQVLEQLVRLVDEDPDRVTRARLGREAWLRELDGTRRAWWRQVNDLSASTSATVRPDHLIGAARRVFSEDAIVIADAGNPGVWSFLWPYCSRRVSQAGRVRQHGIRSAGGDCCQPAVPRSAKSWPSSAMGRLV